MRKWMSMLLAIILLLGTFTAAQAAGNDTIDYNWKQGDARWKKVTTGIEWRAGCAVTAIAIQIARSGLVYADETAGDYDAFEKTGFNPGTFAKAWLAKGGLTSGSSVSWGTVENVVAGFKQTTDSRFRKPKGAFTYFPAVKNGSKSAKQVVVDSITSLYKGGYAIIIEGPGSTFTAKLRKRHYVPVIAADGKNVWIIDPIDGKKKSLFDVQPGGSGTRWTPENLDICGSPKDYACCVLYKANSENILPAEEAAESKFTLSGEQSPSGDYLLGEKFYFKGMISSVYAIQSVFGGIFDAGGQEVQVKSYTPNTTNFDIAKTLDYMIRMAKLPAGDYVYAVCAEDAKGYFEMVIQHAFRIVDGKAAQPAATPTPSRTDAPATSEPQGATPAPEATPEPTPAQATAAPTPTATPYEALKVTISGEESPSGSYAAGTKFYFKGILSSNKVMESVYGGIFSIDGKEVQCASYPCNTTSFDLYKTFDRMIRMGKLPVGEYIYAIYAIEPNGLASEVIVSTFRIV